jgi:hypothetical protein
MAHETAAEALKTAGLFDQRLVRPDANVVRAWTAALERWNVTAEESNEAVIRHYRDSKDVIMPADVIAQVKLTRAEQRAHAAPVAVPSRYEGGRRSLAATNANGLALVRAVMAAPKESCVTCDRPTKLRLREVPRCGPHGGVVDLEAAQAHVRAHPPARPVRPDEVYDALGRLVRTAR